MNSMNTVLDWLGCATFRLTVGEVVVFLDAYLDRVPSAPQPGITADEVDRANWILVGHSHFDHLWGAERIARQTGATVIGSYETVRVLAAQGIPREQLMPVAGGERVRLGDGIGVRVYPSLHSCVWAQRGAPTATDVCLGDTGLFLQEQRERFADVVAWVRSLGPEVGRHLQAAEQGALGDGGALVFLIETPFGKLFYQDTSGCWSNILNGALPTPDVAILAAGGRANLDGEPVQGTLADFVAREANALGAPQVILSHHDDWLPGFSQAIDPAPIRAALEQARPGTRLVELDYLSGHPLFSGVAFDAWNRV
jgi:L-ascorbate metabolism protein UlaG (beta-lactamase superfamily)